MNIIQRLYNRFDSILETLEELEREWDCVGRKFTSSDYDVEIVQYGSYLYYKLSVYVK